MDFNPSSQWLACVTADFSVILIPVYFLLAHGRPTGGSMSDLKAVDAGFLNAEEATDLESIWEGAPSGPGWFGSKKSSSVCRPSLHSSFSTSQSRYFSAKVLDRLGLSQM